MESCREIFLINVGIMQVDEAKRDMKVSVNTMKSNESEVISEKINKIEAMKGKI